MLITWAKPETAYDRQLKQGEQMSTTRSRFIRLSTLAVTGAIAACGGEPAEESIKLVVPLESRTCEPASGRTTEQVRHDLTRSGILVLQLECARYEVLRPAVCGQPTDELAVVQVPSGQSELARRLGLVATPFEVPPAPDPNVPTVVLNYVLHDCAVGR